MYSVNVHTLVQSFLHGNMILALSSGLRRVLIFLYLGNDQVITIGRHDQQPVVITVVAATWLTGPWDGWYSNRKGQLAPILLVISLLTIQVVSNTAILSNDM